MTITFTDSSHATMTRPGAATINLVRFPFTGAPAPIVSEAGAPENGWWWGGSSLSGTGYGIEIQSSSVFIVAYVYDSGGNPTWYLATGNLSAPASYSGAWNLYQGNPGPTLNSPEGTYAGKQVAGASVSMTLTFSDATHGVLTMGSDTIPITRFAGF